MRAASSGPWCCECPLGVVVKGMGKVGGGGGGELEPEKAE